MYIKFKVTEPVELSWLSRMWIQCSSYMQQYRDESEIYNYQRIRLWNNKFIKGIFLGGAGGGGYALPGLNANPIHVNCSL